MNSVGSIWRKWNLHIHTPASFHWPGKHLDQQSPAEREATSQATVDKVNSLDIDAFCIMDYWTFEGYLAGFDEVCTHSWQGAGAAYSVSRTWHHRTSGAYNWRINSDQPCGVVELW